MKAIFLVAAALTVVRASLFGLPVNSGPTHTQNQQEVKYPAPYFCHQLDCPKFTVLQTMSKDSELRRYEPSVWVATNVTVMQYTDEINRKMFFKLFGYISGNNSMHMDIPMTAPVLTEVLHGAGPDCESNFTMNFMIPFNLQTNPPAPTEPSVFIARKPALDAYVKSYGGFSNDDMKRDKLVELVSEIGDDSKFYDNVFFTAGYDGPYRFTDRHNEIWVLAK